MAFADSEVVGLAMRSFASLRTTENYSAACFFLSSATSVIITAMSAFT